MLAYPRHPATVEFGELECCALRAANARWVHQDFISSFIAKAQENQLRYKVSILSEIFMNTIRLVFIPRGIHRAFYLALAFKERHILSGIPGVLFECEHRAEEHITALEKILFKMSIPQGDN